MAVQTGSVGVGSRWQLANEKKKSFWPGTRLTYVLRLLGYHVISSNISRVLGLRPEAPGSSFAGRGKTPCLIVLISPRLYTS